MKRQTTLRTAVRSRPAPGTGCRAPGRNMYTTFRQPLRLRAPSRDQPRGCAAYDDLHVAAQSTRNRTSRSSEKPASRPRTRADTFGCSIFNGAAAAARVSPSLGDECPNPASERPGSDAFSAGRRPTENGVREGRYSLLSTSTGSTRVAATACDALARPTTAIISRTATPYGIGSRLVMPNS